jgi:hypothetical protein
MPSWTERRQEWIDDWLETGWESYRDYGTVPFRSKVAWHWVYRRDLPRIIVTRTKNRIKSWVS